MKNAASSLLITDEEGIFGGEGFQTVTLQDLLNQAEPVELEYPCESDLFACLYTSGSTGLPKGILLEQGNVIHNPESLATLPYSEFLREDRLLVASRFSFVMFLIDCFVALCNGKTVCVPSIEELKNPELLLSLIEREKVRTLISTSSLVEALLAHPRAKDVFCHIRVVSVGREAVSSHFVCVLYKVHPDVFLINSYGCTEICLLSATRLQLGVKRILVGRPIAGTEVLIVDDTGQILPLGQKGNLLVIGPCVMRGYLNLPNEDARAFTTIQGKRFFNTGDIAALTENGEIDLFGRSDDVVKYHGQRVELKEIEKVAQIVAEISSCYVLLKEDILHLFFTAERKIPSSELSAHLHRYLPDYMVSTVLHQLETMPLNAHGKIDRTALKAMEIVSKGEGPKTELEKILCVKIAEILGCNFVSVTESLFSLGLTTSLSAMTFCAELPQALQISTADIKESTTIRDLAQRIEASKSNDKKYEQQDFFPCMGNQRGAYLEWKKDPNSRSYNIPFSIAFSRERMINCKYTPLVKFLEFFQVCGLKEGRRGIAWGVFSSVHTSP